MFWKRIKRQQNVHRIPQSPTSAHRGDTRIQKCHVQWKECGLNHFLPDVPPLKRAVIGEPCLKTELNIHLPSNTCETTPFDLSLRNTIPQIPFESKLKSIIPHTHTHAHLCARFLPLSLLSSLPRSLSLPLALPLSHISFFFIPLSFSSSLSLSVSVQAES